MTVLQEPVISLILPLDREGIMRIIPKRPPFLFVDEIVDLEPGKSAWGFFCADPSCGFFVGHFPGNPVMPEVLILEAICQVGAVSILSSPEFEGKIPILAGIEKAEFGRDKVVRPCDTLSMVVEKVWQRGSVGKFQGRAVVGNVIVAIAMVKFAMMDSP